MTDLLDALFEALMTGAERADGLLQRNGAKAAFLALPAAVLIIYALAPGPYEPDTPCPMDNTSRIGLAPPLWWVGGAPRTPVLSSMGLDPNSRISYSVLLGPSGEEMEVAGTTHGGRERENLRVNITTPLDPGTVYLWQVVAKNRLKKSRESEIWTFSTRALPEIERFEVDRSAVDLGESVNLSWSVINARDAEIEPGVGVVALTGEMSLPPQENVTYILTAINFAGEAKASVDVAVLEPKVIDSMAGGWSTLEDGMGSVVQDIRSVSGVGENATRISYDLVPGGWVGITKTVSKRSGTGSLNLARTDGITFFWRGSSTGNALELRLKDVSGAIIGRSFEGASISSGWTPLVAEYEEFNCIEVVGVERKDAAFNFGNVTAVYFIVRDRENQEFGSSGWIAIDELEAISRDESQIEI
ncbi:MAG: hypothetical protein PHO60_08140 [Methanothrix sp.]|nr:MAG: hypothetical protein APR56_11695 [Methanosaeta sp. SDB]MDD2638918.1 hypothetical protein [Methanothrix sp.]